MRLFVFVLFLSGCYQEIENELSVCKTALNKKDEACDYAISTCYTNQSVCQTKLSDLIRSCGSDQVRLSACMSQIRIDEEYRILAEEECKSRIIKAVKRIKKKKK